MKAWGLRSREAGRGRDRKDWEGRRSLRWGWGRSEKGLGAREEWGPGEVAASGRGPTCHLQQVPREGETSQCPIQDRVYSSGKTAISLRRPALLTLLGGGKSCNFPWSGEELDS